MKTKTDMTKHVDALAIFAARFSLANDAVKMLPFVVERMAQRVDMQVGPFINQATYSNHELGRYIATVSQNVAREMQ